MFTKYSVKKPLTVLVAVVLVIVLGVVSYTEMTPSLFPSMEFPYVIIVTTYIGASPEQVETTVTRPLEQAMATLDNVVSVNSSSSENYSMVTVEFADDANMDSVTVDINSKLTQLSGAWDDAVGTPYTMKINPNMLPVAIVAISREDSTIYDLSDFTSETLQNKLEGIDGVASVSVGGVINRTFEIVLSEDKIDSVNKKVRNAVLDQFKDAEETLDTAKAQIDDGIKQAKEGLEKIEEGKKELDEKQAEAAAQLAEAEVEISSKERELLETKLTLLETISDLTDQKQQLMTTLPMMKELQKAAHEVLTRRDNLQKEYDELNSLSEAYNAAIERNTEYDTALAAISVDVSLDDEQRQAAREAITSDPEYVQAQAELAQAQARIAARGMDAVLLAAALPATKEALDLANQGIDTLNGALEKLGTSFESVDDNVSQIEDGITQIDEGIAFLNETIEQLDAGNIAIADAKKELGTRKSTADYQMNSAAAELKVTQSTVTSTVTQLEQSKVQLDQSIEQLKETKKQALEKANVKDTVTMSMLSQILTAQNFSMPAGYLTGGEENMLVRVGDKFEDEDDLSHLMLFDMGMDGVEPIYLTDVANVEITDNSESIYAKLNGENGVVVSFTMQSDAATAEVSDNIQKELKALTEEYPDLHFTTLMDQGDYIHLIVDSVISNLLWGALFSVVILLLFLRDIRPTFIIACSIPISVIFAIVLMYFTGISLNLISLSGLAVGVGMLVDNSVVVIENIYRLRKNGATAVQAAVSGAIQVTGAIIASTATTVCVFLPIVFTSGITRTMFQDMALTIGYSLLASLIVAITLVPAMAQSMLRGDMKNGNSGGESRFTRGYKRVSEFTLDHKALVILASVVLLAATAYLSISKGFSFMPEMQSTQVTMTVTMPKDSEFKQAAQMGDEINKRVSAVKDVKDVGVIVGSNVLSSVSIGGMGGGGDDTSISVYVILNDESELTRSITEICDDISGKCADLECEVAVDASGMGSMMDAMFGSGLSINVYCNDMDDLQEYAKKIADVVDGVEGTENTSDGIGETTQELRISVDKEKAMKKGLTVAQVFMDISTYMSSSQKATELETKDDSITVEVIDSKSEALTEQDLREHIIKTTDFQGNAVSVKLTDIADIGKADSLNTIRRIEQRRCLTVSADVKDGYNTTNAARIARGRIEELDIPSNVTYELTGSYETTMDAVVELGKMLALAVVFIYMIMVAQFQSLLSPFIIMFTIPLAFTGGFIALIFAGLDMSVIAIIGFVMMAGIIVNNGIVLVDYVNQLRAEGMPKRQALTEAGVTRLRPIFMTALTTILGLSVMAFNNDASSAMMRPIALVCIGGLLYATVMTLFVIPVIYDIFNKKEMRIVDESEFEVIEE
ncbi:MAG: efflux RND transporter permease subunit [Clostridia bacterium]|nr:efflux RND transporter permease subunit [Clostridia bacterium]